MKKIHTSCLLLMAFVLLVPKAGIIAQVKQKNIQIKSQIKNENGIPVEGAIIYAKEGVIITKTNAEGIFSISAPLKTNILIEADGYESLLVNTSSVENEIVLKDTPYLFGEKDNAHIAFGKVKHGELVGNVSVIEPDELLSFDNSQYVPDAILGRIPGMFGNNNIHGLGGALIVVDGIPRYASINEINLNMEEVDQISVLKDINAVALYGSQAKNGVIIITTKRGKANKKTINVSASFGISKPKKLPEYLNSADFMELYNEARLNDGLSKQFDTQTIENYRSGSPYRYPDVDYYSGDYLKDFRTYSSVITEFSGGNENTRFYSNLGWNNTGSLLKIGDENYSTNRFNVRGNVDFKVNDFITSYVDVVGIFNINKVPQGDYWGNASTTKPYLFSPLLPISMMDTTNSNIANLIEASKNNFDGLYLLGGTQQITNTPIGDVYVGGYRQTIKRTMQFSNGIKADLDMITKGLSFSTNISFDFYSQYNQVVDNEYAVYEPTWGSDSLITNLSKYGNDQRTGTQNINTPDFLRRIGVFSQFDYSRAFSNEHHVTGTLLGFVNRVKYNGVFQPDKYAHIGLRLGYNYRNTYWVNFSSAYVNSPKLSKGNKAGYSPTIGLAWVISNENFLNEVKSIDYLKIKASAGIINSDLGISEFYYYDDVYGSTGSFAWSDGDWTNSVVSASYGANSNLFFEKRKEINLGLEGVFFNHRLGIDMNVFNTRIADQVTRTTTQYPSFYSDFIPYENYNEDSYYGLELGLNYSESFGQLKFDLGGNIMFWDSEVIKRDESHSEDYLYRKGNPVDAYYALEAEGFFIDQADIDNHAYQTFGNVAPGDIKYVDQNNDGIIDNNDQVRIGRWQSPTSFGINLKLSYKNFTLFALGTGEIGADKYKSGNYYWVDGDDKYSVVVLDRWTEQTKNTATYPRLSSQANQNNFRNSTFWLYRDNNFYLRRVQLTYDLPEGICKKMAMKKLSVYLGGSNLLLFSGHKDIEELNIGSEPQYRHFTLGIRTIF